MRLAGKLFFLVAAAGTSTPALACSIVIPEGYEGSVQQRRNVQTAIDASPAIIDGEVVRAETDSVPALVYAHHVLRGSDQRWFTLRAGQDSCAIRLDRPGERRRMILSGGPKVFILYRDGSEATVEDAILHWDRRRLFPYFSGPRSSADQANILGSKK